MLDRSPRCQLAELKKKGTVESSVKYVKASFFAARGGNDADDTRRDLQRWTEEIANTRIHGTTHRRPITLFADERVALLAIPERLFELVTWHQGRVHLDTHVTFDKRLYSVPWPLIGQQVWVRATATTVVIFAGDKRVTTHDRRGETVRSTREEHLLEDRAPWRHRDRGYWENRADQIAPEVGAYVREVLDSDDVLGVVRVVQSIVTHLERFPVESPRARSRALHTEANERRAGRAAIRSHDQRALSSQRGEPMSATDA